MTLKKKDIKKIYKKKSEKKNITLKKLFIF